MCWTRKLKVSTAKSKMMRCKRDGGAEVVVNDRTLKHVVKVANFGVVIAGMGIGN